MIPLKRLLEAHGVKTRPAANNEFAIRCIFCEDHKTRLHINEAKQRYHCYHRGCSGHINKIVNYYSLKYTGLPEEETHTLENLRDKFNKVFKENHQQEQEDDARAIQIDTFSRITGSKSYIAKKAFQYLIKRGITKEQIFNYDLRYETVGDYGGRIIIPYYENEICVYFQARAFLFKPSKKVINPPKEEIEHGKSNWLFGLDHAKQHKQVIICEGWASAISTGYNAVAINGIVLSPTQLGKLLHWWDDYIFLLDAHTEKEVVKMATVLKFHKPKARIQIGVLPYGDPNEVYSVELQQCLREVKPFISLKDRYHILMG